MRELDHTETAAVSGASSSSSSSTVYPLAEDMLELIATSAARNLITNKFIRAINGIFGTKIKYI